MRQCLQVTVGSTAALKENRASNRTDPFVVLRLDGAVRCTNNEPGQGSRPVWNHRFSFLLPEHRKDLPEELDVEVWDRTENGTEKFIGSCKVDLTAVYNNGDADMNEAVHRKSGKLLGHIRFHLCLLAEDLSTDPDSPSRLPPSLPSAHSAAPASLSPSLVPSLPASLPRSLHPREKAVSRRHNANGKGSAGAGTSRRVIIHHPVKVDPNRRVETRQAPHSNYNKMGGATHGSMSFSGTVNRNMDGSPNGKGCVNSSGNGNANWSGNEHRAGHANSYGNGNSNDFGSRRDNDNVNSNGYGHGYRCGDGLERGAASGTDYGNGNCYGNEHGNRDENWERSRKVDRNGNGNGNGNVSMSTNTNGTGHLNGNVTESGSDNILANLRPDAQNGMAVLEDVWKLLQTAISQQMQLKTAEGEREGERGQQNQVVSASSGSLPPRTRPSPSPLAPSSFTNSSTVTDIALSPLPNPPPPMIPSSSSEWTNHKPAKHAFETVKTEEDVFSNFGETDYCNSNIVQNERQSVFSENGNYFGPKPEEDPEDYVDNRAREEGSKEREDCLVATADVAEPVEREEEEEERRSAVEGREEDGERESGGRGERRAGEHSVPPVPPKYPSLLTLSALSKLPKCKSSQMPPPRSPPSSLPKSPPLAPSLTDSPSPSHPSPSLNKTLSPSFSLSQKAGCSSPSPSIAASSPSRSPIDLSLPTSCLTPPSPVLMKKGPKPPPLDLSAVSSVSMPSSSPLSSPLSSPSILFSSPSCYLSPGFLSPLRTPPLFSPSSPLFKSGFSKTSSGFSHFFDPNSALNKSAFDMSLYSPSGSGGEFPGSLSAPMSPFFDKDLMENYGNVNGDGEGSGDRNGNGNEDGEGKRSGNADGNGGKHGHGTGKEIAAGDKAEPSVRVENENGNMNGNGKRNRNGDEEGMESGSQKGHTRGTKSETESDTNSRRVDSDGAEHKTKVSQPTAVSPKKLDLVAFAQLTSELGPKLKGYKGGQGANAVFPSQETIAEKLSQALWATRAVHKPGGERGEGEGEEDREGEDADWPVGSSSKSDMSTSLTESQRSNKNLNHFSTNLNDFDKNLNDFSKNLNDFSRNLSGKEIELDQIFASLGKSGGGLLSMGGRHSAFSDRRHPAALSPRSNDNSEDHFTPKQNQTFEENFSSKRGFNKNGNFLCSESEGLQGSDFKRARIQSPQET